MKSKNKKAAFSGGFLVLFSSQPAAGGRIR